MGNEFQSTESGQGLLKTNYGDEASREATAEALRRKRNNSFINKFGELPESEDLKQGD